MKRYIPGLDAQNTTNAQRPVEVYLVQVERARHRFHLQKPHFQISMVVIEPRPFAGKLLTGRLYCTPKALWKLRWFLRDFGYDSELLGRDELDAKALIGLRGVVSVSHFALNGEEYLNFDAFAPAKEWRLERQCADSFH